MPVQPISNKLRQQHYQAVLEERIGSTFYIEYSVTWYKTVGKQCAKDDDQQTSFSLLEDEWETLATQQEATNKKRSQQLEKSNRQANLPFSP